MCKNLKTLSRFNTFPHQILTLSPTVKHSLNCCIKLVYLHDLFKNQPDTRNGKEKKIMSHYQGYFECALQLAAALIEKTMKDSGQNSQTHLNLNHCDHRLAQKHVKNNTLLLNGQIMNSSKMKGFDVGFGKQQESLNPFMLNTDQKKTTHKDTTNTHKQYKSTHGCKRSPHIIPNSQ